MNKNLKIAIVLSAMDKASSVIGKAFNMAEQRAKALTKQRKRSVTLPI